MRKVSVTQRSKKVLDKCLKKVSKPTEELLQQVLTSEIFHYFDLLSAPLYVSISGQMPSEKYFADFFEAVTLIASLSLLPFYNGYEELREHLSEIQKFSNECQKIAYQLMLKEEDKQPFLRYLKPRDFGKLKIDIRNWLIERGDILFLGAYQPIRLSGQIIDSIFASCVRSANILGEGITILTPDFRGDAMFSIASLLRAISVKIRFSEFESFLEKLAKNKLTAKDFHTLFGKYIVSLINENAALTGGDKIVLAKRISKKQIEEINTSFERFSLKQKVISAMQEQIEPHDFKEAVKDYKDMLKDYPETSHRTAATKYVFEVMEELNQAD